MEKKDPALKLGFKGDKKMVDKSLFKMSYVSLKMIVSYGFVLAFVSTNFHKNSTD